MCKAFLCQGLRDNCLKQPGRSDRHDVLAREIYSRSHLDLQSTSGDDADDALESPGRQDGNSDSVTEDFPGRQGCDLGLHPKVEPAVLPNSHLRADETIFDGTHRPQNAAAEIQAELDTFVDSREREVFVNLQPHQGCVREVVLVTRVRDLGAVLSLTKRVGARRADRLATADSCPDEIDTPVPAERPTATDAYTNLLSREVHVIIKEPLQSSHRFPPRPHLDIHTPAASLVGNEDRL